jgi:maltose/moltooligosaccharide transporter
MVAERPDWRLLITMNLGHWGAQLGNGLQLANASAIFEALGAEASQLPLLWLGAPLVGLLTQPIVGELSDRTWIRWLGRWGKRQPYFLGGALLAAVMLGLLPEAATLGQAVAMYWLLQLALNVCIAPTRPLVGDLLSPTQHTLGYAVQGFCIGLGAICASGLPWVLDHFIHLEPATLGSATAEGIPTVVSTAYRVGALICLSSALLTFWLVEEPPPIAELELEPAPEPEHPKKPWAFLGTIAQAIATMPPIMRQLAGVQALTWAGIYCVFLYLPTAIALNILEAPNRQSPSYAQGVEWAGICIAFYNLVCLGASFLIPPLSRRWGRVLTHAVCLMAGCLGMVSLLGVHSRYPILLSMVGIGIAWASILSIPYSLLMDDLGEGRSGLFMGLFNGFVTLPQIVMSLGFGWVMRHVLQGNRLWALAGGGFLIGLAAVLMLRVAEPQTEAAAQAPQTDDPLNFSPISK